VKENDSNNVKGNNNNNTNKNMKAKMSREIRNQKKKDGLSPFIE
jgi:hypothetical protein